MTTRAALFDFSGTLFRLEEDDSWFTDILVDEKAVDEHVRAELMHRLTVPTGRPVEMSDEQFESWINRDLQPHLHREAYLHVMRESGLTDEHARKLYARTVDPAYWVAYPDTADVLQRLRDRGIAVAVVSNIAWDIRAVFRNHGVDHLVTEFVLSFETGAVKPNPEIFQAALTRLGVDAADAVMVGDSEEADGGALAVGCRFALVDPLPVAARPDGLIRALTSAGVEV